MQTTNIDDLKASWDELSLHLKRQNALTLQHVKEEKLARLRLGLRPLVIGQVLQLIFGAVIGIISAQFWLDHLGAPHLLISGLFLHLYGIMFIAFAVRDILLICRIDYAAPILGIQKELAQLRAWHLRAAIWYGVMGSVVWLPVFIMVLHWLGSDAWIDRPRTRYWLLASAAVCLAFNYGLVLLARTSGKCGRALASTWVGRSVNRAQAALAEIEEFERELA
jgi:hypothetical protein